MIDPVSPSGDVCVYYNVLEADEHGRVPSDSNFNSQSKSGLQLIAKSGNKVCYLPNSIIYYSNFDWNHQHFLKKFNDF